MYMYFIGVDAYVFCSIYHIKDVFSIFGMRKIIPIDRKKAKGRIGKLQW